MKKIILLSLFTFMSFSFHQAEAYSNLYGMVSRFRPNDGILDDVERHQMSKLGEVCPNVEKLIEPLEKIMIFIKPIGESVYFPWHCSSNLPEAKLGFDACQWNVGDYTDEGILLYAKDGTRIFVYTDNIDFITDDCFYDEYIYEQTKNFKYTSVMGRSIVVRAYKKTNYKYRDFTKTTSEIMDD